MSVDTVLAEKLDVMDATAIVMCRDNDLPIRVFDLMAPDALVKLGSGEDIGTLVHEGRGGGGTVIEDNRQDADKRIDERLAARRRTDG